MASSQRWNTLKFALYAAFFGAAWVAFTEPLPSGSGAVWARYLGNLIGGAVGLAAMVAVVSGARNFFVMRRPGK